MRTFTTGVVYTGTRRRVECVYNDDRPEDASVLWEKIHKTGISDMED